MKDFIIWFKYDGKENYAIFSAYSKRGAIEQFNLDFGLPIVECHQIMGDNR